MTSVTEVLRRMLDERGVEYTFDYGYREFFWDFGESCRARASAIGTKGLVQMIVTGITPEQAIAATLGATDAKPTQAESSGTCRIEYHYGEWYCTSCGEMVGTCDPESELCVDATTSACGTTAPTAEGESNNERHRRAEGVHGEAG